MEYAEGNLCSENQLDPFSHFGRTPPVTDGQTNTGPQRIAYTALCIFVACASRGKMRDIARLPHKAFLEGHSCTHCMATFSDAFK